MDTMVIVSVSIVSAYIIGMVVFSIFQRKRMNTQVYYYGKACYIGEREYARIIRATAKRENWSGKKLKRELTKYRKAVKHAKTSLDDPTIEVASMLR